MTGLRVVNFGSEQFDSYVKKGNLAWEKARKLVALADEQDKFPGGIEASELQEIYDDATANTPFAGKPKTFEEAEIYYSHAASTFQKMLGEYSGYKTVVERSKDIGCSYEYNPTYGRFCPPGSVQEESSHLKITCTDIGVENIISEKFVLCHFPPRSSCDCDYAKHGTVKFHNTVPDSHHVVSSEHWQSCFCPIPFHEQ